MSKRDFVFVVLVAFLAGVLGSALGPMLMHTNPALDKESGSIKESAYERVMRTQTLRCGYAVWAPYLTKDSATGAVGGIWHDFTETLAAHLGLKVEWAEEVGFGEISTALDSRRIDAYCAGLWTAGKRMRVVDYLKPSAFEPMVVYVRANDHRFDTNLEMLNDPSVIFSTIDGEGGGLVAAEEFPKARTASLPQMTSAADMFNQVVMKKADAFLSAPSGVAAFLINNPESLRALNKPVRIFPVALAVKFGENELKDMLNQAQDYVIENGEMEKILSTGEYNKNDFWRTASPYAVPAQ